ncbi:MAG TPA: outer membrane protein assembly factor BamD [Candidatus Saccharimonadia bacterium]|nr:outer membrane protein assembly factor BamD [Candidatus Saccharimonadia bacterium]
MIFLALALSACGGRTKLDATELLPVDELYAEAKQSLDSGNYDRSIRYYKRLVARFPFGRYTEQAQLDLAFAQFKSSDNDEAFSTINRFVKTYPTHRHIDYAFYLRGLINFNREIGLLERYIRQDNTRRDRGFARQSFKDFGELLERYPNSRYAPDARQRMVHLRNGLAQSELNVAEFYFRRKAYVAAQGRAKYIIENYQETPQSADALAILAESYRLLGEEKLATDTKRVLELNYPDHAYLNGDWPARVSFWRRLMPFRSS